MKYISMLRGINVSGQKAIKMADLKALYEKLGLQNVVTYIQSGNVIFHAPTKGRDELGAKIETAIQQKYKFDVPVIMRTQQELANIVANNPFGAVEIEADGARVYVGFLSTSPSSMMINEIQKYVVLPEKLVVKGTEVYLYCPNGYGKSKLSNAFLEQKLGVVATTRNWKTVCKLLEISA